MRLGWEQVGARGGAVLALSAVAVIAVGAHGAADPGLPGTGARLGPVTSGGTASPTPTPGAGGPTPAATAAAQPTPGVRLGPLLQQSQYASFSFQVYPGPRSAQAQAALAGFNLVVHQSGSQIQMVLSLTGGGQPPARRTYASGDHLYFVEANFGDDSAGGEYNLGDDGILATTAQGRIIE
ncbi:MAG TPA: hypothetical protein VMW49_05490 [Candidatus Dormibacteraeota bacterium]|nr:hypothetical protein [Candidatus Dormibacteraeota bacterium]